MGGEIDQRVPQGGTSLLRVFAIPGLVLGFLCWLVVEAHEVLGEHVTAALLSGLVFGSGAYLLVVLKGQAMRAVIGGVAIGLVTAGLSYLASFHQAYEFSDGVLPMLANLGIVTVALPFLRTTSKGLPINHYPSLYADAWNIPVIVAISLVFVLVGAGLAALVAALFAFIGLDFLRELMTEEWFIAGYLGMLIAIGVGVTRQREAAVLAARGIKMALLRVVAPVFAVCVTVFVVAVLLRGFGSLLGDLSPMATLVAAAVVSIVMVNALVADTSRPEGMLFGATSRLLGILLLFLMSLAVYGLYLRVSAEGWTPNRITAALAVTLTALYAPTYAAAALTERWVVLRQGNIAISALLLLIAVFVQTPLFKPYTWSAVSQVEQITKAPGDATAEDLRFLRDQLGAPGETAFAELQGMDRPELAAAFAEAARPEAIELTMEGAGLAEWQGSGILQMVPEGAELGEGLASLVARQIDGTTREALVVLQPDREEAWLFDRKTYGLWVTGFRSEADGWVQVSSFGNFGGEDDAVIAAARQGAITAERRSYDIPTAGGIPIVPGPETLEPFEVPAPEVPEDEEGAEQDPLGEEPPATN